MEYKKLKVIFNSLNRLIKNWILPILFLGIALIGNIRVLWLAYHHQTYWAAYITMGVVGLVSLGFLILQDYRRHEAEETFLESIKISLDPGDLLDKFSILTLKKLYLTDPKQTDNIIQSMQRITIQMIVMMRHSTETQIKQLSTHSMDLMLVNSKLWDLEVVARQLISEGKTGTDLHNAVQQIQNLNHERSIIKGRICRTMNFPVEVKDYSVSAPDTQPIKEESEDTSLYN